MPERRVTVGSKVGLHARPAMQFVDVANQFSSAISVHKGGDEPFDADGKSIMDMIILAAVHGTPLRRQLTISGLGRAAPGPHRITARVRFRLGSGTSPLTLSRRVRICAALLPRFTG